jgi:AcrR family transcriptional regulator
MAGVRTPRQKRGQDTWERLLDAAEQVLAEDGFDGFTLTAVSRRAGISNGAIYWRVDSMDSLFAAVHDRVIGRLREENAVYDDDRPWAGLTATEVAAAAVAELAGSFRRHRAILRALVLRSGSDPASSQRGAAAVREASERFVARVAAALAAAGCDEPDVVAATIFRVAFGALTYRISWPEQEAGPRISWKRFVADLGEMASAYAERHLPDAIAPH